MGGGYEKICFVYFNCSLLFFIYIKLSDLPSFFCCVFRYHHDDVIIHDDRMYSRKMKVGCLID